MRYNPMVALKAAQAANMPGKSSTDDDSHIDNTSDYETLKLDNNKT